MYKVIKVKVEDFEVINSLENDNIIFKYLSAGVIDSKTSSTILLLSKADMDIFEDELLKLLQRKGITNGEVNQFGKKIDNLIDKFNHWD